MDLRIGDGLLSVAGSFIQIRRYGVLRDLSRSQAL
jgi:hypothetical protein